MDQGPYIMTIRIMRVWRSGLIDKRQSQSNSAVGLGIRCEGKRRVEEFNLSTWKEGVIIY